jgi:UDP-N-acetylmuramate--alanine ligase
MKIHFVGIGGIGVSALARYYLKRGHEISGSDLVSSEITESLKKMGVQIFIGKHSDQNLPKAADLLIYSPAVPLSSPELKAAQKLGIKPQSYPEALGELTKKHFTIAISGTHGKSTTTAMIGLLLEKAGLDPTVIVGTKLKEWDNSNCRVGDSKYLVIEADEWQASFLNYWPEIIVLTNIEKEHMDYFKDMNHVFKTYKEYVDHLSENQVLVANKDDKNVLSVSQKAKRVKFYSMKRKEVKKMKNILQIPGEHNVSNALAVLTVARILGIPDKTSFKTLSEYKGSWRRFEEKEIRLGKLKFKLISDYGHHPTEIKVTLKAAREKFLKKRIWCVFQPHQYQRTFYLWDDFVKVFQKAPVDRLIITDIYDVAGREKRRIKKKVNSKKLVEKTNKPWVLYLKKDKIIDYLKKNLRGGEVVIIMGAGNIYNISFSLTKDKKKKK